MLKRERVISSIWLVILVLFSVSLVPGLAQMFSDQDEMATFAQTFSDPTMLAMLGPLYDANSIGGMFAFMMLLWTQIAVGLMNVFLVVRHTRADEELGRVEVIRSLPVGRLATSAATMLTVVFINGALAISTGVGIALMGETSMSLAGSILYGTLLGTFGIFCAAITAIFAQLCVSSRTALALGGITIVFSYILRAVGDMPNEYGDMPNEILSYLSPMGLLQRSQVFVKDDWLPVLYVLLISAMLFAVAFALDRVRDMGQGFIPAKPGLSRWKKIEKTTPNITSLMLSVRLCKNAMIWWLVGMFILAASYGSILGGISDFIEGNEFYGELMVELPPELMNFQEKSFVSTIAIMLSICGVIPVLVTLFKLRTEEKRGMLEQILSGAVSRRRNLANYTIIAMIMSVLTPFISALGFYVSALAVMEDPLSFSFFIENLMVYVPATWVMLGVGTFLVGILPKATVACWGMLGFSIFVMFFGRVLGLPEWLEFTTPFGYIPLLIIEEINWLTMVTLTGIAAILTVIGFVGYQKRDMIS